MPYTCAVCKNVFLNEAGACPHCGFRAEQGEDAPVSVQGAPSMDQLRDIIEDAATRVESGLSEVQVYSTTDRPVPPDDIAATLRNIADGLPEGDVQFSHAAHEVQFDPVVVQRQRALQAGTARIIMWVVLVDVLIAAGVIIWLVSRGS